jgi:hypothetical protein
MLNSDQSNALYHQQEDKAQAEYLADNERIQREAFSDFQFIITLVGLCVGVVSLIAVASGCWR